jgi:hypothetical protein
MLHHLNSDSIHLDPKLESRRPLVALSQQLLPSSDKQESGELFLLFSLQICAHVLIIGWHISKHLMRTFLFIFHRLDEMRGELKTYSWAEPTRIPTFFPPGDSDPNQEYGYHIGVAIISMLFGLIHCLGWSLVFPSGTERLIWRLSAVIISALPVLVLCSYSIHPFLLLHY